MLRPDGYGESAGPAGMSRRQRLGPPANDKTSQDEPIADIKYPRFGYPADGTRRTQNHRTEMERQA